MRGFPNLCDTAQTKSVSLQSYLTWSEEALLNLTNRYMYYRRMLNKSQTSDTVNKSLPCSIEGDNLSKSLWTEKNQACSNSLILAPRFKLWIKTSNQYNRRIPLWSKARKKTKSTFPSALSIQWSTKGSHLISTRWCWKRKVLLLTSSRIRMNPRQLRTKQVMWQFPASSSRRLKTFSLIQLSVNLLLKIWVITNRRLRI